MIKAFFCSRKWALWAYGGLLLLIILLFTQVQISVRLNTWYGPFNDMLQKAEEHSVEEFWGQLKIFAMIALPYAGIATITGFCTRIYSLRWREAITFNYIPRWRNVTEEIEGASQRIQEDAYRLARIVESLGLQFAKAVMTLMAFLPILWALSSHVHLELFGIKFHEIPGSLVWLALCTSLGGMAISWLVGIKLPGLEYNNQKVEATFRKELVLGEDDKKNHASIPTLLEMFTGIRFNYHRLFMHYGYFDVWVNLYDQFMVIVPYIIMGPSLFPLVSGGTAFITLGVLSQTANAFDKVHGSFALFIMNWTTITELRSIVKRLKEFEENLDRHQNVQAQ